jgi:hypothetical protein
MLMNRALSAETSQAGRTELRRSDKTELSRNAADSKTDRAEALLNHARQIEMKLWNRLMGIGAAQAAYRSRSEVVDLEVPTERAAVAMDWVVWWRLL